MARNAKKTGRSVLEKRKIKQAKREERAQAARKSDRMQNA